MMLLNFMITAVASTVVSSAVINVPGDHPTIQQAINAAVDGDTVLVSPGTYYENIDFLGKDIVVESSGGAASTTIDGGGIATVVNFVSGEPRSAVLDGFTLTNGFGPNTGPPYPGGAVTCRGGSSPTIKNNVMELNSAAGGGGVSCDESASPLIINNIIQNNVSINGGGIMIHGSANPTIQDCLILNNSASNPGWGGGIQCAHGSGTVINTVIALNSAGKEGGGVQHGHNASMLFVNCLLWGNSCPSGGGIFAWLSTATFWNSILWANSSTQIIEIGATVDVNYSDVQGSWPGTGNIDADPLLVDPANNDFHLTLASPCVDAATSTAPGLPALDFEGDARLIGGEVDMGPDERISSPALSSVTPNRGRYDQMVRVALSGSGFTSDTEANTVVTFENLPAQSVVIVDDQTITCDAPLSGLLGQVDVTVANTVGSSTLLGAYTFTPALQITGNPVSGGTITLNYLCDPGDSLLLIYGPPPELSIPTPPYDGVLGMWPFFRLLVVFNWPFDAFSQNLTIPPDPSLSGLQVLFQGLIGPSFGVPKDAAWTNVGTLDIQ